MGGLLVAVVAGCFAKSWRQALVYGGLAGALIIGAVLFSGAGDTFTAGSVVARIGISMILSLLTYAMGKYAKTPTKQ
ncbi:hypothetical protein I5192_03195 [Ruegeria sp. SCSIO 43209]|uniref:hypothetical protein n=1 Tax=Ruegeria sp. SCSIO 43209 TaxID=2793010 RepID=UPI00147E603A|nr:hypothetical protein [Ruegeria sp. SCSIO 43209]UAB89703.1 hypothetical protein I5192_03195 [Ruegeria sp. SCSIO 43209]